MGTFIYDQQTESFRQTIYNAVLYNNRNINNNIVLLTDSRFILIQYKREKTHLTQISLQTVTIK